LWGQKGVSVYLSLFTLPTVILVQLPYFWDFGEDLGIKEKYF
jgi:hypothetical protein